MILLSTLPMPTGLIPLSSFINGTNLQSKRKWKCLDGKVLIYHSYLQSLKSSRCFTACIHCYKYKLDFDILNLNNSLTSAYSAIDSNRVENIYEYLSSGYTQTLHRDTYYKFILVIKTSRIHSDKQMIKHYSYLNDIWYYQRIDLFTLLVWFDIHLFL